jgi:hypothetical protein
VSRPLIVSIPHRLGRQQATDRLKNGLDRASRDFAQIICIDQHVWNGDVLTFGVSTLGQHASGRLGVLDDSMRLEVTLPGLLAKVAERVLPTIEQKGRLLLDTNSAASGSIPPAPCSGRRPRSPGRALFGTSDDAPRIATKKGAAMD